MIRRLTTLAALLMTAAACSKDSPIVPTGVLPDTGFAFTYVPPASAPTITSITVPGSFNGWSSSAAAMKKQTDGSWLVHVPNLAPGRYQYKFFINGAWPADMCGSPTWGDPATGWIDADAIGCVDDANGGQNAVIDVGPPSTDLGFLHSPSLPAYLSAAGGQLSVRFRASQGVATAATVHAGGNAYPMHLQFNYQLQDVWRAAIPTGTTSYTITVQTAAGAQEKGPFSVPATLFTAVPWVGTGVGYQILTDRFWNGDTTNDHFGVETDAYGYMNPSFRGTPPSRVTAWNGPLNSEGCCHQYFGGDLQGIVDKLDHLSSLGVTLIYLNPIWSSGSVHGYDTFDYLQVEPTYGDTTVLRALLTAAHARGMHVMWDFVPNHTGVGHWAFQDAVAHGTASPTWNWYTFYTANTSVQVGNAANYQTWAGAGSLPKLRTTDTAVFNHLIGAAQHWTQFGFDGIRVDVPNELSNATQFFRAMRTTVKAVNPDEYLVGEIWQRNASWLQGDQFDALMNYATGRDILLRFVNGGATGGSALQALAQLYTEYPEASAAMEFNLIASHDTERLLTGVGGGDLGATPSAAALAKQRLASAMLYALPGVPITWQGDECAQLGAAGDSYGRNRYPVQWGSCNATMLAHYQQLAGLRHANAALQSPAIRGYRASATVVSFFRGEPGTTEILAVFNSGASAQSLPLPAGTWVDAESAQTFNGTVSVDALGWRYLKHN